MLEPSLLWLEVTNRCNGNCIYCARQYVGELHDMDFDLYKKIIDSCSSTKTVQTSGFGEPLLYPHIVEAVAYAKRKGKYVRFLTNASLLNEDLALQLLQAGLDEIRFSVDECTREGYESLRLGLKWKTVLDNIIVFEHLNKKGGYGVKTLIKMTRTKENSPRIQKIETFWKRHVGKVSIKSEVFIPPPNMLHANRFVSGPPVDCKRVNQHLSVKNDGTVILCCRDWFAVYPMGNLKSEHALDVFNGETFFKIRKSLRMGKDYPTICGYCKSSPRIQPR
jgi:sulfatase maturation enzyme AslB (radical SAM superfamily)